MRKSRTINMIAIFRLKARDFLDFLTLIGHASNCNSGKPPQSLVFSITNIALAFLKIPSVDILPSISLNERFKLCKKKRKLF